jgi:aerobic carbon-monoxide dehydrogenase medium subunit
MIPTRFEYFAPRSVQEAVNLLEQHSEDAKVLAGGHSLLPQMKLRLATPKYVVDISRVRGLDYIKEKDGHILIGALATHYALETSPLLQDKYPMLAETASAIGDVQVRNRGTIGGSLAHADPAADWPAAILASNAELHVVGTAGERVINAEDFFVDMLTTALQPTELLVEIRIPQLPPRTGGTYLKMRQRASGFAIVGVAARVTLDSNQICQHVRIAITGVAPKAYRAKSVETELKGRGLDAAAVRRAAQRAPDGVDALADLHASSEYRAHLATVYTRRAVEAAHSRAR